MVWAEKDESFGVRGLGELLRMAGMRTVLVGMRPSYTGAANSVWSQAAETFLMSSKQDVQPHFRASDGAWESQVYYCAY